MQKRELKVGEIVQLNPETVRNKGFAGCMFVVVEPKEFGAMGFAQALGTRESGGGQAYYRAGFDEMEPTGGMAVWLPAGGSDAGD